MTLPAHWLDSQKLALGLNLASTVSESVRPSIVGIASGFRPCPHALMALHPATLQLLIDKGPRFGFRDIRAACHLEFMRLQGKAVSLNPLAGAKLVANRMLAANLVASQIANLIETEVGCSWDRKADSALQCLLSNLRDRSQQTAAKLASMSKFRSAISELSIDRWEIIENAVLQQYFVWPLLVGVGNLNYTLPVTVDVSWTNEERAGSVEVLNNSIITLDEEFRSSLTEARTSAIQLWLNKHMSWPPRFIRHMTQNLVVTIDFQAAESIVGPYYHGAHITLTGKSAGLYFALAILSKLVNPSAMEGVCATGIVGSRLPDPEGGADHRVTSSGEIKQKYEYAQENYFSSFIATNVNGSTLPRKTLRLSTIGTLSEAASVVFGQQWRKHRYVRAPDLAHFFRPEKIQDRYTGSPADEAVDDVVRTLGTSGQTILSLNTSGRNVARALYLINHRIQTTYGIGNKAKNMGTFSFVRSVPDEMGDRFWRTIWYLLRDDDRTFDKFQSAPGPDDAAGVLAEEFNQQPYGETLRAPDVLVVVLCGDGQRSTIGWRNGPFPGRKASAFEEKLERRLRPTPVPGLRPWLGKTRLVLVTETPNMPLDAVPNASCLSAWSTKALDQLSVFRFGFAKEMARRMWKIEDSLADKCLRELKAAGSLRFAEGAGEYMLVGADRGKARMAGLHHGAALAILGYLSPDEDARRWNLTESLAPHWIHEAQWHLRQAVDLETDGGRRQYYSGLQKRVSGLLNT